MWFVLFDRGVALIFSTENILSNHDTSKIPTKAANNNTSHWNRNADNMVHHCQLRNDMASFRSHKSASSI